MCTVTYIPQGNNEFLLASNRDENNQRSTNTFETKKFGGEKLLFPVDPISGGSWIVASSSARVACVLNGAFEKHHHIPPYARSRGLVLLDYFQLGKIEQFSKQYDLKGIEPFTMIVCEQTNLFEFRWDGTHPHLTACNPNKPHIWSSSSLYDQEARHQRNGWFRSWLTSCPEPSLADQIHFHRFGGELDPYNGIVMNRQGRVQTLSVTAIERKDVYANFHHHDLIRDHISQHRIDFSENEVVQSI